MNCVEFCMKEVFKCRQRRMMPYDEEWTKAQAWGCPLDTLVNIHEIQASKLGDARGTPSSSIKSTRSFFNTLYFIASCDMCYSWSVFIFCVFSFVFNKFGPRHIYFGVRHAPLYCIFTLD